MHTETVTVTPELAKKWLEQNSRNRTIAKKKKEEFKDDMERGAWNETHQGIAFYETGELADGQHRLAALVEAGKSYRFNVTYDLPIEAGAAIDRHRPRSQADSIRIGGLASWIGQSEVTLIRMIANAHTKGAPTYSSKHIAEIGEFVKKEVQFTLECFPSRKRHITIAPVLAAVAIARANMKTADEVIRLKQFCEVVMQGMPLSKEPRDDIAAIKLREQQLSGQYKGGQSGQMEVLRRTQRAIKAFMDREQIQRLRSPDHLTYTIENIEDVL